MGSALLVVVAAAVGTTSTASAEAPTGWSEVAHDDYDHSVSSGWGTPDLGGVYSTSGTGTVADGTGVARVSAGGDFRAVLPKVSAADVDVTDQVVLETGPATYNVMSSWSGRRQADGSEYNASVAFSQSGRATLSVSRVNGSSSSWLDGVVLPFAVKAGTTVRGELQVTGTSPVVVKARAWRVGDSVPGWQVQQSDTGTSRVTGAGMVGIRNYAWSGSSVLTLRHDDLSVAVDPADDAPDVGDVPANAGRGTVLGSQAFPVPSGAVFVDGRNGSTSGTGSQGSPLKTVAAGVARAADGGTVVVRAGTYHESVTSGKTVTIQNYPNEVVWFDGSVPVGGWTRSGSTWVSTGWTAEFDSSMGGAATKARYVKANPLAANADQVFVDGKPLTQVASQSDVGTDEFAVNYATNTIAIGTDPTGKEVRASDLKLALALSGAGSVVQGVGVRRYATTWDVGAAVRLSSPGGTLRHIVVADNAFEGVALSNVKKTVDHVVVTGNGQLGIGGTELDESVVQNSVVNDNNTENFKDAPVSGGIKLTRSRTITVRNNEIKDNQSAGVWFDASCYKITAVGNDVENNRSTQIQLEVSAQGVVANNTVVGGQAGVLVYDTSDVKVYNNAIGDYAIFGVKIAQDYRRQSDASVPEAHDPRRPVPDPTVTWITKNVVVSNNVFGNSNHRGGFQIYALDGETNRSADSMNITVDGNLFVKRINKLQSEPTMVAWGQGDNHTLVRYETPGELAAKNGSWKNAQAADSYRLSAMGPAITANAAVAKPLPSDVASAAGLPAGSVHLGTY